MRQAGRYLPEYREIRKKAETFVAFCLTPDLACEATLQPLKRFDLDAAILFADILLIPFSLGRHVVFEEEEGPRIDPVENMGQAKALIFERDRIEPVYETIAKTKERLNPQQAFIGFCGGAWTVVCYMIEGRASATFGKAVQAAQAREPFMESLLNTIVDASLTYALGQIRAGVDVFQVFESHAGLLQGKDFDRFVIEPTRRLVTGIRNAYPSFPVIGFPRGAGQAEYKAYFEKTGISCCGVDHAQSLSFVQEALAPLGVIQGNLDPAFLLKGGAPMRAQAEKIMEAAKDRLIFNLGHGVLKETPPENVAELVRCVHGDER